MLGTQSLGQDNSLRLKCLIVGESTVFTVIVQRHESDYEPEVSDLKKDIQREGAPLKNVHHYNLELWKVSAIVNLRCEVTPLFFQPKDSTPIFAMPDNTLRQCIRSMGNDLSVFADKLDPSDSIFRIFSAQPDTKYIHIIVKVAPTGEWSQSPPPSVTEERTVSYHPQ